MANIIARIFLVSLFLIGGAFKISDVQANGKWISRGVEQYVPEEHRELFAEHLDHLTYAIGAWELLGALLVVLGVKAGAGMLILFLLPTTALFHNFWAQEEGSDEAKLQFTLFFHNVMVLGGLLIFLGEASGAVAAKGGKGKKKKQKTN